MEEEYVVPTEEEESAIPMEEEYMVSIEEDLGNDTVNEYNGENLQSASDEMEMKTAMSQSPINVSGIEERIERLSTAIGSLSRDTKKIENKVDGLESTLNTVQEELHSLSVFLLLQASYFPF